MSCPCSRGNNNNFVTILQGGQTVTLTPSQELLAAGTIQVAKNSESATAFPASGVVTQTQYPIPPITPGANP